MSILSAPWKIGTYLGAAVSVGLGIALFLADARADRLSTRLTVAETDVATCQANKTLLKADLAQQNQKIADLNTAYQRGQQIAKQQVEQAQRAARGLRFTPPKGNTEHERVLDVDRRIMGELK